jgi:hypothetical protein
MNFFSASTQLSHPTCQIFGVTALLCNLISGPTTAAQTTNPVKVKSITLGLVSGTSQKEVEAHFQNFVRYVARNLGSGPDTEGKVVIVPTALQMAKFFEEKRSIFTWRAPTQPISSTNRGGDTPASTLEKRHDLLPGGEELVRRKLVETFRARSKRMVSKRR